MSPTENSQTDVVRALLADAAVAFLGTVVVGLIIASLAAAGIITLSLAYILLGLAWLVGFGGTFFVPWQMAHHRRAIFVALLAVMLAGVGWYETRYFTEPLSAKDVAQEVSKLLATSSKVETKSVPAWPNIDVPLISTIGKTHFRCPLPPVPTDRTREQIQSEMKEKIQAARGAFGVSIEVSEIENGRKIVMKPLTEEAKSKMWGATSWTLEWRKSGPDLLITSITDLPEPIGSLTKVMPAGQNPDQVAIETAYIEGEFHIPRGKCHML
jgi:hypothetical protein